MALSRNDLIGILVVPATLALVFVLLAVYFFIKHWLIQIMMCFWRRGMCLSCQMNSCEKLMEEENEIYVTDTEFLHPEKSVPHTLSVELTVSGSPCSGRDRSNNV